MWQIYCTHWGRAVGLSPPPPPFPGFQKAARDPLQPRHVPQAARAGSESCAPARAALSCPAETLRPLSTWRPPAVFHYTDRHDYREARFTGLHFLNRIFTRLELRVKIKDHQLLPLVASGMGTVLPKSIQAAAAKGRSLWSFITQ